MLSVNFRQLSVRWLHLQVYVFGALLTGCAAIPPTTGTAAAYKQHQDSIANIEQFRLEGRIGVQAEGKGFSGSTHWQHDNVIDNITLFSPLGSQVAAIRTTADGVELITDDGKIYNAKDAETLTQQNLGWSLPMQGLPDWVLGRPASHSIPSDSTWDATGKLSKLKQDGWEIEYSSYIDIDVWQLPNKINLRNPKLYLKLIIERWEVIPSKQAGGP